MLLLLLLATLTFTFVNPTNLTGLKKVDPSYECLACQLAVSVFSHGKDALVLSNYCATKIQNCNGIPKFSPCEIMEQIPSNLLTPLKTNELGHLVNKLQYSCSRKESKKEGLRFSAHSVLSAQNEPLGKVFARLNPTIFHHLFLQSSFKEKRQSYS